MDKEIDRLAEDFAKQMPVFSYSTPQPRDLTALRKLIESNNYQEIEELVWSNPKYLISVSDTAVYLMAGPKWNACHIAARSNKPDIMALILDTVSNTSFAKKLYPDEPDATVQDRVNHLTDSYLNTPEPRGGNTPLHYACKNGYYKVVRVLMTFEKCDVNLRDSDGKTAEQSIGTLKQDQGETERIRKLFKRELNTPSKRAQLKKMLLLTKLRYKAGADLNQDISFAEDFSFVEEFKKPAAEGDEPDDST